MKPALLALFLVLTFSACAHTPVTPPPEGGIPTSMVGEWRLQKITCSTGTASQIMTEINAQIAQGTRSLWYSVAPSGQVRVQKVDPFEWSAGTCVRQSQEIWGVTDTNTLAVSTRKGTQNLLQGMSPPQHSAVVACPPSFEIPDVRSFQIELTSSGFNLALQGTSAGYCFAGPMTWVFSPGTQPVPSVQPGPVNPNPPEATVRAAFVPYTDQYGLISPNKGGGSGNGLLYSGEYALLLKSQGYLKPTDLTWFQNTIQQCEVLPGLLKRSPTNGDQEGPDDYVGVAAGSNAIEPSVASRIYNYGENQSVYVDQTVTVEGVTLTPGVSLPLKYVYNNVLPGTLKFPDGRWNLSAWLGRQLNLVAHIKYAAGQTPNLIEQAVWSVAVLSALKQPPLNQDSWFLSWLLVETGQGRNTGANDTSLVWRAGYEKTLPGGRRQLFRTYFANADHPFALYWNDEDFWGFAL